MSPGVYIAQLLCPARHCVLGVADLCRDEAAVEHLAAVLREFFEESVNRRLLNPKCDLCESRELKVETARTRFDTMEEALPALRASEELQRQSAAFWKGARN